MVTLFTLSRLRTSYVSSLHETINSKDEQLGKTISQLAAVKTMNQNLEKTIKNQIQQIEEMVLVNKKHSESLAKSHQDNKALIQDYKISQDAKVALEKKLHSISKTHESEIEDKVNKLNLFESAYKKLKNSYKIVQKSNDNLCEERDFYREEFISLRDSITESENLVHIKSA